MGSAPIGWPAVFFLLGITCAASIRGAPALVVSMVGLAIAHRALRRMPLLLVFGLAGFLAGRSAVGWATAPTAEAPVLHRGIAHASAWGRDGCTFALRSEGREVLVRAPLERPPAPGAPCAVFGSVEPMASAINPRLGADPAFGSAIQTSDRAAVFIGSAPASPVRAVFALRQTIRARITRLFEGDGAGLLAALLLGDYSLVSAESLEAFRRLGLLHVLAISGVHMGVLAGIVAVAARVVFPRGSVFAFIAAAAVVAYAPIAGGSGPVVRAACMSAWGLLLLARGRAFDPFHVLSATLLATSACSPAGALSPGYLLSYGATFGILAYARWAPPFGGPRVIRHLAQGVAVSAFATLATLPCIVAFFGTVPIGGVLYSIPAEIVSGLALVPAFAGLVALPMPWLSDLFFSAAWPALAAMQWLASRPLPAPSITLSPESALAPFLAVLAAVRPSAEGRARWGRWVPLACAVALVVRGPRPPEGPVLTVLDVGAADALFLDLGDRSLLVDTGRASHALVVSRALSVLARSKPTLVLTHPDDDHDGGARTLVERGNVRGVVVGVTEPRDGRRYGFGDEHPLARVACGDTLWRSPDGFLACVHPAQEDSALADNERSVVLELGWRGARMYLTGDLEGKGLARFLERERGRPAPASGAPVVLKLGHHGSPAATPDALLGLLLPTVAVSSTGRPLDPDLERRLRARGVTVLETGGRGALQLRFGASGVAVYRWRGRWIEGEKLPRAASLASPRGV